MKTHSIPEQHRDRLFSLYKEREYCGFRLQVNAKAFSRAMESGDLDKMWECKQAERTTLKDAHDKAHKALWDYIHSAMPELKATAQYGLDIDGWAIQE